MSVGRRSIPDGLHIGRVQAGEQPVTVPDRHVFGQAGVGVPDEQMVVKLANLAQPVVMTDVVEIDLRQRDGSEPEDQQDDPQASDAPAMW